MDSSPTDKPSVYEELLTYFAKRETDAPDPIAHPDPQVNELARAQVHTFRPAAVLLPITRQQRDAGSQIVLTVRSENLKSHAGQISLPGGTQEDHDQDVIDTALRESQEEIGLHPDKVEILGKLGELALPSGFRVTPVVGIIEHGLRYIAQPEEVADIFHAPLELVLDVDAYSSSTMTFYDKPRKILELRYEDYRIWGATAAILFHLAREVSRSRNSD